MNIEKTHHLAPSELLPEDNWFVIAEKLAKESGEVPDPLVIRATAIISALGLPSGEISALKVNTEGERTNAQKDRVIAKYLTNRGGVLIDSETGVVSTDFRDIYPEGLPQELKDALEPATREIMEIEYKHLENTRRKFGDTEHILEADSSTNYFRLPGGVDLFLRGYAHHQAWHKHHGGFLQKINARAQIIAIEGFSDVPFGASLDALWSDSNQQEGDYDALMHEAVDTRWDGLFTEVDARDESKILMDSTIFTSKFPKLPDSFFTKYFEFLERERPRLSEKIGSSENLKQILAKQSTTNEGIKGRKKKIYSRGKGHLGYPYLTLSGEISLEPTFLELGKNLFTDALAALKLQLIAKLMADEHLPKGPIIDYQGAFHVPCKSFFLRYPSYALEVVLRSVNQLMAGRVKKRGNLPEVYQVFETPDWTEIVREIVRLPFKKTEDDFSKPTALGPDQRKLLDYPVDFLQIYGVDPARVVPTDEDIQKIRERISSSSRASR